ncbi:MAG: hypothetical protein ACREDE_02215 [Thermoplasmata archaeon]
MVRILTDWDIARVMDRRAAVELMEERYRTDARGEVFLFPRSRTDAREVTLAWMGAAVPPADVFGFRSYLYDQAGTDRGDQVVALYRYSTMELKGLFLGPLLGTLRTGAAVVAALRFVRPDGDSLGLIGTGTQARQALACAASALPLKSVWAWSPNPERRERFQRWARETVRVEVRLADDPGRVLRETRAIALLTSSETPVITPEMMLGPRLLLSINSYRRPEIDPRLLEGASHVWTDSIEQARGPGSLFRTGQMGQKLLRLADPEGLRELREEMSTRIVINTGAAWEEVLLAESLWQSAERAKVGFETVVDHVE